MIREQAIAVREAFNAFCDGKEIQLFSADMEKWVTTECPTFHPLCKLRVKPEPLESWAVLDGKTFHFFVVHGSAVQYQSSIPGRTIHHLKEVE